jgi:hypothetical protein
VHLRLLGQPQHPLASTAFAGSGLPSRFSLLDEIGVAAGTKLTVSPGP